MTGFAKTLLIGAGLVLLAGCNDPKRNSYAFDGFYYRAKAKAVAPKRPAEFVVSVRDIAKSVEGAREAAAYTATKYCVNTLGTADIEWSVAPDAALETIAPDGSTITVAGTCIE